MRCECDFGVVDAIMLVVMVWMRGCEGVSVCVCRNGEKKKGAEGEDMFGLGCALVLWWMHACALHP